MDDTVHYFVVKEKTYDIEHSRDTFKCKWN